MIRLLSLFALMHAFAAVRAQDFIRYRRYLDSASGFSIDIPEWRLIPQGKGSALRLYAYDSSSAVACTAQTYLQVRYVKTNTPDLRRSLAAEMNARKGKNHIRIQDTGHVGGIPYFISQDSVVCRPGEIETYIDKHFVIFVWYRRPYRVTLTGTAIQLDEYLEEYKRMAASVRFE